jgi:tyrosyl-tRNA synthetase
MSISDDPMLEYFELLTDVSDRELNEFKAGLADQSANPMELKKCLAREVVTQLYDQRTAAEAEEHFAKVFQQRGIPDEISEFKIAGEALELDRVLLESGLAKSRSDARRLISQGAVAVDGERRTDARFKIASGSIIKVGKRHFLKST